MDHEFVDVDITDFIAGRVSSCSSNLKGNRGAYFSLYRYTTDRDEHSNDIKIKFNNLIECFTYNGETKPANMNLRNTLWLEQIANAGIKGLGSVFFNRIKDIALEGNFKYVFLYPSAGFGGEGRDRNMLISYYKSKGFKVLKDCQNEYDFERVHPYDHDNDAPARYHFMWSSMDDFLVNNLSDVDKDVNYRQKYLKYKQKYLELKNKNKTN
jgi:hypothetical protein